MFIYMLFIYLCLFIYIFIYLYLFAYLFGDYAINTYLLTVISVLKTIYEKKTHCSLMGVELKPTTHQLGQIE